jgi:hypothetical protein
MIEHLKGVLYWSREHNSKFEVNKFTLIDFTRSRTHEKPPLTIQNAASQPSEHHRFLGLIVDHELTWKHHVAHAIAKGTGYVLQLRRLSRPTNGVSVQRGSIGVAEWLAKVQQIAALSITGAMRNAVTDILNAHANLLPTETFANSHLKQVLSAQEAGNCPRFGVDWEDTF